MKRLLAVIAVLLWAAVLCAVISVAGPHGAIAVPLDVRALALVAALTIILTVGLAWSPVSPLLSYAAAHIVGVALVAALVEWPRPPWAWRVLAGILSPWTHGTAPSGAALALLAVGLTWELSFVCAWLVVRDRRPWLALGLIGGTVALAGSVETRGAAIAALCVVGLALALANAARQRRLAMPRLVSLSGAWRGAPLLLLPLCGGLVAGAWDAPIPPAPAHGWWQMPDLPGAVGGLLSRLGLGGGQAGEGTGGLGDFGGALRVGGRFTPDDAPVFMARVADPTLSPYWRAAVYDIYAQGVWSAVPTRTRTEAAGAPLRVPSGAAAVTPITATISPVRPSGVLFSAGLPLRVTVSASALIATGGVPAGIIVLKPAQGRSGGGYVAVALPAPTTPISPPPTLASALAALDLALPPLPARVRALGLRLTAGIADPYARAWAIQVYLRRAGGPFSYDTAPPAPPAGEDPVDYFLFSSRRGFCTQFATAMVVLARAAGIPARLVTGYAAGHLEDGQFVVTDADAHAWPELWIAGRGWITFEPTPNYPTPWQVSAAPPVTPAAPATSRATIVPATPTRIPAPSATPAATRAQTTAVATHTAATRTPVAASPGGATPRKPAAPLRLPPATWPALLVVALLACLIVLWRRASPDALALYGRMSRLARYLGVGPVEGQTPLEWAQGVAACSPADSALVEGLTMLYLRQRYGRERPAAAELAAARSSWRTLRTRWLRRLLARQPLT